MIIAAMVSNSGNRWVVALATFALWAFVAGSAVYWGLKLSNGSAGPIAAPVGLRANTPIDSAAVARLLGANPTAAAPAVNVASRFALLGVVASASREGAALISVDGKPPKPFRVGATVDEGVVLQSVEARRAVLGPATGGPAVATLDLPLPVRR